MNKRVSVKTIYLLMVISIGLIGLALGSTFAMFEASASIENPISLSSSLTYSEEVFQTINIILDAEEEKELTLNITNSTTSTMYYSAWYLNEGQNIDFATDDDTTGTIAGVTSETLTITIRNNTSRTINVTIGVSTSDDNNIVLSTGMVLVPKQAMPFKPTNLVTYITNLYTDAVKTEITNNNIAYNTAPTVSLMNDRLGGTTNSLDGGNIRYYGASPQNYIYFNCSDYSNQTSSTCEKWRIIGIFNVTDGNNVTKKMVKIVRNDSIGNYSWDNKDTTTGSEDNNGKNDWTTARLMKLLNPDDYYTVDLYDNGYGQSLYYNSSSNGTCFAGLNNATTPCDFSSSGIKNNTTRNKIAEVVWNLGGWNDNNIYPNQIYGYERGNTVYQGRPTIWIGKIALIYSSDYAYSSDLTKCKSSLESNATDLYIGQYNSNVNSYQCRVNNWLRNNSTFYSLTPCSSNARGVWTVNTSGNFSYADKVYNVRAIRPTLYLNADTMLVGGEGTTDNPYQID